MDEVIALRTYTRKVFDMGGGVTRARCHIGHIHYRDDVTGDLVPVDYTWVDRGTYWEMARASYRLRVAKDFGAPNLIQYSNRFDGASHDLVYEPHSLVWATGRDLASVQVFRTQQSVQGVVSGNSIRWANAFGNGLHFELTLRMSGFTKELVIQRRNVLDTPPTAQHRLVLLSRYQRTGVAVKDSTGRQWDEQGEFDDANDDGFKLEEASGGRFSLVRAAYMVESDYDNTRHRCPVVWTNRNGAMWQAKVLPTAVLNNGTYPLRADTVTSYYASAGDGYAEASSTTWDLTHDHAGSSADYTSTTTRVSVGKFTNWNIRRSFFPVDTSGIPDGATINSATFYAKCSSVNDNEDDDGDDFFVIVGPTSQASNTSLVAGDYDACGAIDSPQELTDDRKDFSAFSAASYASWALNATGLSNVSKTGYTLLGLREGHDVIDSSTPDVTNVDNQLRFYTSEQSGTGDDPYLEVDYTDSGGAVRGIAFGNRGVAFNGGRTFMGPIG